MVTENAALALGIWRADALIRKRLEGPLGGGHGLGYTDFIILSELASVVGGRLRPVDLAARLQLTPSGVTRAVLPLAKTGFVERESHERDARASYISITPAGRARVEEALPTVERVIADTLSSLTRSERLTLVGLVERLGY
ncbi:MAG TPA: MarR family transcriptional regulator [Candidatus Baltobacteraceae bacterium]|jgi:DNA-binding MarR family transcriptional regulator|nr:MarR family transcriptional regulator [Candidatus Baltobacteraceae bacterium]